jgi:hypothetical protein
VTPFFLPEGVAGLTEYMKGRVLVPFSGSFSAFRGTIHHEMVHVFQLSMQSSLYRRYFRQSYAAPPLWLGEGLADYLSEPWEGPGEMILSDLVIEGRLPPIDELWRYNGTFALYKLGQRLVAFLIEEFGPDVIARLYENLWVAPDFATVLEHVTGLTEEELTLRWHQAERERYYPRVLDRRPIALEARALTREGGANFTPVEAPEGVLGAGRKFLFVSPRSGYTNIYAASMEGVEQDVEVLVHGERSPELESLHPFVSRIDVSGDGRLAFASKWSDRDALFVFDLHRRKLVGRHRFETLVGLASPSWSADGRYVVFQGLTTDAYSDLFIFEPATASVRRLTHDLYQDLDPDFLPDGRSIVFSSDRTESGDDGAMNLFVMDLESGRIRYLTRGPWRDYAPRCDSTGSRITFASTRDGQPDLYEVNLSGRGRRLTRCLTGTSDPSPTRDGRELLFTGYARGQYQVYTLPLPADTTAEFALAEAPSGAGWGWEDPAAPAPAEVARYRRRFSLDFAQGAVVVDPLLTDAQGAQIALTDMLGDEVIVVQAGNSAERGDSFVKRINAGLSYLNLRQRLNYGINAYHVAGDFVDDRDFVFFERRAGASFIVSYPFSKFRRVESTVGLAYSDKRHPGSGIDRRAYLATNSFSWVHDNTLWIPTGPVDGARARAALGLTLDLPRAEVENVQALGDFRRYIRTGLRSAWALRLQARWSVGSDPRYWSLGGTHTLRGYPRRDLFATRTVLFNNEYRFPLIDGFVVGFPFGAVEFPGVEGAAFVDAASLWNAGEDPTWPPFGSLGVSFRMSFGGLLVFRLDFARRTDFKHIEGRTESEFFIGWNY